MEALRISTVQSAVHLFKDVAPLPEIAQAPLPVLGQHPAARHPLVGEAKTLEVLEPANQQRRLRPRAALGQRPGFHKAFGRRVPDLAIERSEALLVDLALVRALDLPLEP